jgi:RNA polymerase sigma-70 factor (ECF subfamily)
VNEPFSGFYKLERDGSFRKKNQMSTQGNSRREYTDEELLQGIQGADHDAFTTLYAAHFKSLVLTSVKYVKDIDTAREVVQTVFMKLWESPPMMLNANALRTYLHRAAINHSINHVRRQKMILHHHLQIADTSEVFMVDGVAEAHDMNVLLHEAIEALPPQCKKIFKMSRFENLKYREIAERLGVAEKTIENHVVNALRLLRARLRDKNIR